MSGELASPLGEGHGRSTHQPRGQARRRFVALAAALAGTGSIAAVACGYGTVDGIAPTRSYRAPKPAKLTVQIDGTWETHRALRERLFPIFEQRHHGISITLLTGSIELPALRRQAASGRPPDLALFGASQVAAVAEAKLVVPLGSRISAWGHLGDFLPISLTSSQWAGKQWGLPLSMDVRLYLWRKSILENAGFDRAPATWDDVTEAVRRSLLIERGTIVREGYPKPDGWFGFAAALATLGKSFFSAAGAPGAGSGAGPAGGGATGATGGVAATGAAGQTPPASQPSPPGAATQTTPAPQSAHVDIAGPDGVAALNHLLAVYRATRPTGVPPIRGRAAAYPFASGQLAHTVDSATTLRALEQTFAEELDNVIVGDPPVPGPGPGPGPTSIPSSSSGPSPAGTIGPAGQSGPTGPAGQANQAGTGKVRPITLLSCEWLGVSALSAAQDQAWALLQYLLEPTSLVAVNETRYFRPPRKSLSAARYLRQPHLARMVELADRYGYPLPRVPEQTVFRDTLRAVADEVFAGRTTVEQALAAATRTLQLETDRLGVSGFAAPSEELL